MALYTGFIQLGAGLSVGLAGLSAGFAIGIVGDAGVRGVAQQVSHLKPSFVNETLTDAALLVQSRVFVGMVKTSLCLLLRGVTLTFASVRTCRSLFSFSRMFLSFLLSLS